MSSAPNVTKLAQPPRPPKPSSTKGAPPAEHEHQPNTQKPAAGKTIQMPVQVTVETRRAFKSYAAEHDLNQSELFMLMWEEYRKNHP